MCSLILTWAALPLLCSQAAAEPLSLESPALSVQVDSLTGAWSIKDRQSAIAWPTKGSASAGMPGPFVKQESSPTRIKLTREDGSAVLFQLADEGRSLLLTYEGAGLGDINILEDALTVTKRESGTVIVPSREGLLIPANSGVAFRQTFGASEYEGCHMNMLGFLKSGSALVLSWDGSNLWPVIQSKLSQDNEEGQVLTTGITLKAPARSLTLTPLGQGDWNTLAAGYRRIAESKGLASTLHQKIARNPRLELLLGASNVKLWTCLARRMNEESTSAESVNVNWTFDEAASIAEHIKKDLAIDRCLFMMGGWTEGGYDCRHPDNLPANPECGGNDALANAMERIQALDYVGCLHDNYQDMYRDAKSWDPAFIEKKPDGSLITGGRWLGGRAYMVCAPKQLELAMRPQNLPEIARLFKPWSYFIDTTYAVPPRVCADPNHPIARDDDIAWKIKLSQAAREQFGLFGSECGREWALPHSDFFEGLTGVSGKYFHNLKPETLGARVIPFFEMVYHDCQICYGKYGYQPPAAAEYVTHHVLSARPLNYHSIPHHLYWKTIDNPAPAKGDLACFTRTDNGWAEGMHPTDAFLKNTHELLGPLHRETAHQRLTRLDFLNDSGSLRKAQYGDGPGSVAVTVNIGNSECDVQSALGGAVTLGPFGFIVEGPRFAAFHARKWNGRAYPEGAMFTIQLAQGETLAKASRIRVFHAFGDPTFLWNGNPFEVRREALLDVPVN